MRGALHSQGTDQSVETSRQAHHLLHRARQDRLNLVLKQQMAVILELAFQGSVWWLIACDLKLSLASYHHRRPQPVGMKLAQELARHWILIWRAFRLSLALL